MLNNNKFNIIHISDLHFGEKSIANDSKFKTSFEDFFSLLEETMINMINNYKIKLLIISGDIISKGNADDLHNKHLENFLQIFINNNIPICIANGNHDLDRDSIQSNSQFDDFIKYMRKNSKKFNSRLSKKFKINQASFIYLKEYNSLFFAMNSCKNIEKRLIDEELKKFNIEDLNKYLDKEFLDIGIISRKDLSNLFIEIKKIYGDDMFNYMNKYLICHHPLINLNESKICMNFLEDNNIKIIFSGHTHDYYYWSNQKIHNIGVGSLLAKMSSRMGLSLNQIPVQFNIYQINLLLGKISPINYFYDRNCKWEFEYKDEVPFDVIHYYPIEKWCEIHQIRSAKREKLKKLKIVSVFEEKKTGSGPFLSFFDIKNRIYRGFMVKEDDTQGFIDQIKNWYIRNIDAIKSAKINFIIIKNTSESRFISQLPNDYII